MILELLHGLLVKMMTMLACMNSACILFGNSSSDRSKYIHINVTSILGDRIINLDMNVRFQER